MIVTDGLKPKVREEKYKSTPFFGEVLVPVVYFDSKVETIWLQAVKKQEF